MATQNHEKINIFRKILKILWKDPKSAGGVAKHDFALKMCNYIMDMIRNQYIKKHLHLINYSSWQVSNSKCFGTGMPSSGSILEQMNTSPTR
jgi:hypothetical protein